MQPSAPSESARTIQKSIALAYFGYVLRYVYLLVLIPFYGRILGTDSYGRLLTAMALFQVIWTLVDWGLPIAGTRDVAQSSDRAAMARHYGQQMSARLWLLVPAAGLSLFAGQVSPVLSASPTLHVLAVANGLVAAFNMGWYFVGAQKYHLGVWVEVLGFALNLGLILGLVRQPGDEVVVMGCLLASSVICTVVAHGLVLKHLHGFKRPVTGGLLLIRHSTTLFAFKGLSMMMVNSTSLLMSTFATPAQLGIYGAADRLVGAALSLLQPANQVLIGFVSKQTGSGEQSSAHRTIKLSAWILGGVGLFMCIFTIFADQLLLRLIFGASFVEAGQTLQILSVLFPLMALSTVINSYILIPHRLDKESAITSLAGAILMVGLILTIGPSWGLPGVAWSRVLSTAVMLVWGGYFVWVNKILHAPNRP